MTLSGLPTEGLGPSPAPPGGDLSPGALFAGRYRIEGLLGRGGFGGVYRARDELLDRFIALKVIHRAQGDDDGDLGALLAEPRTVARLDHSHIVPVYDAGVENGVPWISSRLVEGWSLKEILQDRGPLDRELVLRLLVQTASALAHAHARGIVHRDIKPGNLLLETRDDGSEHLWITDFGIAKLLREVAETTGRIIGTPAYMAPEQMSGGRVDERTDLFALGCVAAELLTGRRVFDGPSFPESVPPSLIAQLEERAGAEM
ncbi:MAG TPA: serine/threonine-protein kinase, partial [Thermoanaerobaculia bacterium]|nr:serine/threonine-protein kinase [Thermoanaerobaculia bacterium]